MSRDAKQITIHGGGLAGLALGIALRNRDVPVSLLEAGSYPRHRVCGEFISGAGVDVLKRLEAWPPVEERGVLEATTVTFNGSQHAGKPARLPKSAWCVSRHVLDETLAELFQNRGGNLITHHRAVWKPAEGFVRATGRVPQKESTGYRQIGFKAHASDVDLRADLEMHHSPQSYVGLCRLPGGEVNVCGLLRTQRPLTELKNGWQDWIRGCAGRELEQRLQSATFDPDSFCVVAGLSYAPPETRSGELPSIGDAAHMIPPITGNGMSMAFESGELAAGPIGDYADGLIDWPTAQETLRIAIEKRFSRRLRWANRLQRFLLSGSSITSTALLVKYSRVALPFLFRLTR
ncbi:MAG: NAD(P)/FAD-dependent oxidoreductase [Verrucomicrobiia bacterium]|jgi:2-polyprenyl-6-methoxyphenol hydroxylase-like FAD-dependent oxidoreductase